MDRVKIAKEMLRVARDLTGKSVRAMPKVWVTHSVDGDIYSIVISVLFNRATNLNEVTEAAKRIGKVRDLFIGKARELSANVTVESLNEIVSHRNRVEISSHLNIRVYGETGHLELQDFIDRF